MDWLEGLDDSSVWNASCLVTGPATDTGWPKVPVLQKAGQLVTDNKNKGKLFFQIFFPMPNPDTPTIPNNYCYPQEKWNFTNITDNQIHHIIQKLKPYKVTKRGTIPNSVLIHAHEALVPHLGLLF